MSNFIDHASGSQLNLSDAQRHIEVLTGSPDTPVTFQFFDDGPNKNDQLAAHVHGVLRDIWLEVVRRQSAGAGVFVTVCETNGQGRSNTNIVRGRAVWADDDTARPEARTDWPVDPHLVVESSPGKRHYYWLTDTEDLKGLDAVVKAIAVKHSTDTNATGVTRVLRLAGTLHLKDPSRPHLVRIEHASTAPAYDWANIRAAFPSPKGTNPPPMPVNVTIATAETHDWDIEFLPAATDKELKDLRSALMYLAENKYGDNYHDWAAVGQALKGTARMDSGRREIELKELWRDYSRACPKFESDDKSLQKWEQLKGDRSGKGAIFKAAQTLGWVNPARDSPHASSESLAPKTISLSDVLTDPPAPQRSAWGTCIPVGVVTLLGAHGGTGKSTFALQLCAHVAVGKPFLGLPVEHGHSVYLSAEDSTEVVRRRHAEICRTDIDALSVATRMTALDATHAPTLYRDLQGRDRANPFTETYMALRAIIEAHRTTLLVIDNASDTFDASEIDRARVREFMRGLAAIASEYSCAVVLLVHVAMRTANATSYTGGTENYSGSTAWHNSARSRLFLSTDKTDTASRKILTLTHEKNNYGLRQQPLLLEFGNSGLLQLHQDPAHVGKTPNEIEFSKQDTILRLIAKYSDRGTYIDPNEASRSHAYKVLCDDPDYPKSVDKKECLRIVARLNRCGWLSVKEYKNKDSKEKKRWLVSDLGLSEVAVDSGMVVDYFQ